MSSVEIYVHPAWSYGTSLPSPRNALSAATLDNSVFVFGKGRVQSKKNKKKVTPIYRKNENKIYLHLLLKF